MKARKTRIKVTLNSNGEECYTPQVKRFGFWWNIMDRAYLEYTSRRVIAEAEIDGYLKRGSRQKSYPVFVKYPEDQQ